MTTNYTIREIAESLTHDEIKNIIIKYGEVFQKPVEISNKFLTNCKTLRDILNKISYKEQLSYDSIMNWLNEIHNDVIDATIEDKDKKEFDICEKNEGLNEPFISETEEIEKLRVEIDKINKIEVEVQNKKKELMKELNSKLSPLPPIPHFKIPQIPPINEMKPKDINSKLPPLPPIPHFKIPQIPPINEMKPKDINNVVLKTPVKNDYKNKLTHEQTGSTSPQAMKWLSEIDNAEALIYLKKGMDRPLFNSKFYKDDTFSKFVEVIEINEPQQLNKCLQAYNDNERQMKYSKTEVDKKNIDNEPVQLYYLNKGIHNFDKIFSFVEEIYNVESKPFKITFSVGGIYEIPLPGLITYEYREPNYNISKRQIPITIHTKEDLNILMCYINNFMYDIHKLTSSSSDKLCWITSFCFNVSRCHKINYVNKQWLPIEIINSRFIITDAVEDSLCWYRFIAACIGNKSQNKDLSRRTTFAQKLLLEEYGLSYNNMD